MEGTRGTSLLDHIEKEYLIYWRDAEATFGECCKGRSMQVQEIADLVLESGLRVEHLADRYLAAKARKAGKKGPSVSQETVLGVIYWLF